MRQRPSKARIRFDVSHPHRTTIGLTFESLAKEIGRNEIYVAALFYGQAKPSPADITVSSSSLRYFSSHHTTQALSKTLDVDEHAFTDEMGPHWWPNRGLGGSVPQDPGSTHS
jgi:cyanate lyase